MGEPKLKISFALVAHGSPNVVTRLIRLLVSQGHSVAVHYDLKSPRASYEQLTREFKDAPLVRFAKRVRVGWGEWSVVQATLNCLDEIEKAAWEPEYVYLISGLDYPIRPCSQLEGFLTRNRGEEFIESVPSETVKWVKTGPQRERYRYHWFFNWRDQPRSTELVFKVQKALRLERKFVRGMTPWMGSQWWVLTWSTLKKIMVLARKPEILKFFKTTLIPDELFFQTLVRYVVSHEKIINCPLTLYQFSDYGYPVVYHRDHLDYLLRQPFFMARKLSPHADGLRDVLDDYWVGAKTTPPFDDEDVGIVTPEYEDWRLTYRNGPPGLPIPGRSSGRWHDDQKRLTIPYFVLIGASTAELRLPYKALSWRADLLCHGQLFHPMRIELASGLSEFAGYGVRDLNLRMVSAPNFVADIVRGETKRMSGFVLRWGQGWHMTELMVERPNVRIGFLRGEPLTSFLENVMGADPLIDEPFDLDALKAIPHSVMANRFRRFLNDYVQYVAWLDKQAEKARTVKPRDWARTLDVTTNAKGLVWGLESLLGTSLSGAPQGYGEADLSTEMARMAERREVATEMLIRGGINQAVFTTLRAQSDNPTAALSLL